MIGVLCFLIVMSGYFSATETAFTSLNRIRMKNLASGGSRRAGLVLSLSENYDQLLSAILVGNNIVNITSASLATVLFVRHFGDLGVTLSTVIMTVIVLIFGEVTPKSLAKEMPERFALFSAPIMKFFIVLLTPFVFFFVQWKKLMAKLIRVKEDRVITEEELITIVDEARQEGGINEQESALIRSAIEFNDLEAKDILTPRVDLAAIALYTPKDEIARRFRETGFSRMPVYEGTIDQIAGVIHHKDFYNYIYDTDRPLSDIVKDAVYAAPGMKISRLLKLLQKHKAHIAVVTDEYGGTMGIVTLEDIVEQLVGDIWDEHDEITENIVRMSEHVFRISCGISPDEMFRLFGLNCETEASTVGGWVLETLHKIPEEGESFAFENLEITVQKADQRRVVDIIVKEKPRQTVSEQKP